MLSGTDFCFIASILSLIAEGHYIVISAFIYPDKEKENKCRQYWQTIVVCNLFHKMVFKCFHEILFPAKK